MSLSKMMDCRVECFRAQLMRLDSELRESQDESPLAATAFVYYTVSWDLSRVERCRQMEQTKEKHAHDQPEAASVAPEAHDRSKFLGIGVKFWRDEAARYWAEFLILQLALIVGAFAAFFTHSFSDAWRMAVGGGWQTVFIASATMSIGFGAAMLLYGRLGARQAEQLEADYQSLVTRADSLLKSSSIRSAEKESDTFRAR
jgi:hypothetical protein